MERAAGLDALPQSSHGIIEENALENIADDANEPLLSRRTHLTEQDAIRSDDGNGVDLDSRELVSNAVHQRHGKSTKTFSRADSLTTSPYVFFCAIFSALGGLIFGIDQGIVSIILVMPRFLERFPEVSESAPGAGFLKGLLTAMIEVGALLGASSQGCIADRISRRNSIVLASGIFVIGSSFQTAATGYTMLAWARFVGGIGIGMLSMVIPLYISEISPPKMRGALLVLEELSIVTGIVIAFWITYLTRYIQSDWSWRLPFLLQIIPGVILCIGILFLPFSPRWLVAQGRDREALEALSLLRQLPNTNDQVVHEWLDIRAEVQFHNEVASDRHQYLQGTGLWVAIRQEVLGFIDCFKEGCWKRTHVGIGLMFFQQFVGINALIYYSPTLFKYLGLDSEMQLIMSGVLNCVQLVGVLTSLITIDKVGRRPLLLVGSVLMFLSHFVIAILVRNFSSDWAEHRFQGWLSVCLLLFFMFVFGASWGPCPWAIPSEIFPSSLRSKGVALSTSSNWINNAIIGVVTPPLIQNTNEGAYAFFATFCLLAFIWTYLFVPETNGKTLEQMDDVFDDKTGTADQARKLTIRKKLTAANDNFLRVGRLSQ